MSGLCTLDSSFSQSSTRLKLLLALLTLAVEISIMSSSILCVRAYIIVLSVLLVNYHVSCLQTNVINRISANTRLFLSSSNDDSSDLHMNALQPRKFKDSVMEKGKLLSKLIFAFGTVFNIQKSVKAATAAVAADASKVKYNDLPYGYDSLEPYISSQTLKFHHDKHYRGYVANTNKLIADSSLANADIYAIMEQSYDKNIPLYNSAAQVYNHDFYFKCMTGERSTANSITAAMIPSKNEKIAKLINDNYGSVDIFSNQFKAAATTLFGSGWVWLCYNKSTKKLEITQTSNAETPMVVNTSLHPILTIDVWEHAYYLDVQNKRNEYINGFVDNLINWEYVETQLNKVA